MHHPEHAAQPLRQRSAWREPFQVRGSRAFDAESWEDAAAALAGASPLAYQAFMVMHSEDPPGRELLEHLFRIAERELVAVEGVTPVALVELAIAEARSAESQRSERARCLFLGLSRGQWRHRAARPYSAVAGEIDRLHGDAWRAPRKRAAIERRSADRRRCRWAGCGEPHARAGGTGIGGAG